MKKLLEKHNMLEKNLHDHLCIRYYLNQMKTINDTLISFLGKTFEALKYNFSRRGVFATGVNQGGGFLRTSSNKFNVESYIKTSDAESNSPSDSEVLDYFINNCETIYHQCCTCRMGMNHWELLMKLQIHGFSNLRVIDVSVFPNITSGNINPPTMVVGKIMAGCFNVKQ